MSQAQFVLGKKVSIMWFKCGNFDNRLGDSFEPMLWQCSAVDSPSTNRNMSFAGRAAVTGKSEKETQRRIDSFMFFLPPTMTVKEETSDGLTSTTE